MFYKSNKIIYSSNTVTKVLRPIRTAEQKHIIKHIIWKPTDWST